MKKKKIILASPRGFCSGVKRALDIVEEALGEHGPPIYVRHQIVHNKHVVEGLAARGVVFVEDPEEVPAGSPFVISAHGVAPEIEVKARARGLEIYDATCPIVKSIHKKAASLRDSGYTILLIGHPEHPETIGTRAYAGRDSYVIEKVSDIEKLSERDPVRIACITQTTFSRDDVREIYEAVSNRFPGSEPGGGTDICYATMDRQNAVRELAGRCDSIIILGSRNSSNSQRLRELGEDLGVPSFLIDDISEFRSEMLDGTSSLGISAGASSPEHLVSDLIKKLGNEGWELEGEPPEQ